VKYTVYIGKDKEVEIPVITQKKIIHDHMIKYYHWTIGISALIIGFLMGVIASGK
jgi:hypothetical protein